VVIDSDLIQEKADLSLELAKELREVSEFYKIDLESRKGLNNAIGFQPSRFVRGIRKFAEDRPNPSHKL